MPGNVLSIKSKNEDNVSMRGQKVPFSPWLGAAEEEADSYRHHGK